MSALQRWRHLLAQGALLALLLLGAAPAAAVDYVFPGTLPPGCTGSGPNYTCGSLSLGFNDTITINTPRPARITINGNFSTNNAVINGAGAANNLIITVNGTVTLGYQAVIRGHLIADAIDGSNASEVNHTGSMTALVGNLSLGFDTTVTGTLRTVTGQISTATSVTVDGAITSNTGAVTLGFQTAVTGQITTAGAITTATEVTLVGHVNGAAGAVSLDFNSRVQGITTTSGTIALGQQTQAAACVRSTDAASITLPFQASAHSVCCGASCGTACVMNNSGSAMPPACSAGIVHIGSSSSVNSSAASDSLTLTRPGSVAAGDVMIAWVTQRTNSLPLSTQVQSVPAGWTVVLTRDNGSSFGTTVYSKVAGPAEAGSYSWRFNQAGRGAGGVMVFRGVDTTTPVGASASQLNAAAADHATPSLTTTSANAMLVALFAVPSGDVPVATPSGLSPAPGGQSGGGLDGITVGFAFGLQASAGSTGSRTSSGNISLQSAGVLLALRPATGAPVVNHYQTVLPTSSVSCAPSTVTITACADASSPCTSPATTVDGQTATLATSAGTLSSTSLVFNSAGVATATLSHPAAADGSSVSVTLSGESTAASQPRRCCPDGASCSAANSCATTFRTAGFIFAATSNGAGTTLPAQTAGTASATYFLRAVRTGTTTQACEAALTGAQSVDWGYECLNPGTCATSNLLQVNGGTATTVARNNSGSSSSRTAVAMTFDSAGSAPFSFTHADVGQLRLHASRAVGGATLSGSSNSLVVRPARFALSDIRQTASPNTANPGASNAAGARFIAAGEAFSATLTAQTSTGATAPSFGRESPAEGVVLNATLVQPSGGTSGTLANATIAGASFSNGSATATTLAYSEVGIVTLTPAVADGDYLGAGAVSGTASGNVGRFVPARFAVSGGSVTHRSALACSPASSFSHLGENFRLGLTLTAQNTSGATTTNYQGDFARFAPGTASGWRLAGISSGNAFTVDNARLSLGSSSGSWAAGVLAATLTAQVTRPGTPEGPHDASFGVAPVDSDGVATIGLNLATTAPFATSDRASVATVALRHGRLRLASAIGPADRPLALPLAAQFWNGSAWAPNTLDSCTAVPASALNFGGLSGTLTTADTAALGGVTLNEGRAPLRLAAPGGGRRGSYSVALSLGATAADNSCLQPWSPGSGDAATAGAQLGFLRGAWCGSGSDHDPAARASFGRASSDGHLVFRQENP